MTWDLLLTYTNLSSAYIHTLYEDEDNNTLGILYTKYNVGSLVFGIGLDFGLGLSLNSGLSLGSWV